MVLNKENINCWLTNWDQYKDHLTVDGHRLYGELKELSAIFPEDACFESERELRERVNLMGKALDHVGEEITNIRNEMVALELQIRKDEIKRASIENRVKGLSRTIYELEMSKNCEEKPSLLKKIFLKWKKEDANSVVMDLRQLEDQMIAVNKDGIRVDQELLVNNRALEMLNKSLENPNERLDRVTVDYKLYLEIQKAFERLDGLLIRNDLSLDGVSEMLRKSK